MGGRGAKGGGGGGGGNFNGFSNSAIAAKAAAWDAKYGTSGGGGGGSSSGGSKGAGSASTGGVQNPAGGGGSSSGGGSSTTVIEKGDEKKPVKFPQASKFREWAAKIWPASSQYKSSVRTEYSNYSHNWGYQTINGALRRAGGDPNEFDNIDLLTNWEGKTFESVYGSVKAGPAALTPEKMKARVARMDEGMDFAPRTPTWMTTTRGTDKTEFAALGISNHATDAEMMALVGKKYTNHAYTSTSLSNDAAMYYKAVHMHVTIPPGMKGLNMAGDKSHNGALSSLASENEFLLNRNTQFKITSVKKVAGKWEVEVVVVGQ